MVDLVLVNQCCLPGNNGLNSRSGPHGISTNVALLAGGYGYETMLLPRTSKQGKEKTLRIVGFGPSALSQQFSMSSLSPVLRYVIIIHSGEKAIYFEDSNRAKTGNNLCLEGF